MDIQRRGLDDGLIVKFEGVGGNGLTQFIFQDLALLEVLLDGVIVDADLVPAQGFRLVKGHVGIVQQFFAAAGVSGIECDADAGADDGAVAFNPDGLAHGADDFGRDGIGHHGCG